MTDCLFLQKHQQWCNKKHRDRCEETEGTAATTTAGCCGSRTAFIAQQPDGIRESTVLYSIIDNQVVLSINLHIFCNSSCSAIHHDEVKPEYNECLVGFFIFFNSNFHRIVIQGYSLLG